MKTLKEVLQAIAYGAVTSAFLCLLLYVGGCTSDEKVVTIDTPVYGVYKVETGTYDVYDSNGEVSHEEFNGEGTTTSLDFCTKHNVCFFKQEIKVFSQKDIEYALDLFIDTLPFISNRYLTDREIERALSGLVVQWSPVVIELAGKRYLGLQLDKWAVVVLQDELDKTAFFHELLHVVDKNVYNIDDINHEDVSWWRCEAILNRLYKLRYIKKG